MACSGGFRFYVGIKEKLETTIGFRAFFPHEIEIGEHIGVIYGVYGKYWTSGFKGLGSRALGF